MVALRLILSMAITAGVVIPYEIYIYQPPAPPNILAATLRAFVCFSLVWGVWEWLASRRSGDDG